MVLRGSLFKFLVIVTQSYTEDHRVTQRKENKNGYFQISNCLDNRYLFYCYYIPDNTYILAVAISVRQEKNDYSLGFNAGKLPSFISHAYLENQN